MIKKFENFDKEECCPSCNETFEMCTCENEECTTFDVDSEEEFNEKKKWIQDAIKHPGALKKSLGKKEGEKISKSEINSELSKLKAKDKDKKKPGTQLDKKDATKKRRLELAKTLKSIG